MLLPKSVLTQSIFLALLQGTLANKVLFFVSNPHKDVLGSCDSCRNGGPLLNSFEVCVTLLNSFEVCVTCMLLGLNDILKAAKVAYFPILTVVVKRKQFHFENFAL